MATISSFLMDKLSNYNVKHIFNVPGDYSLNLCKNFENNKKFKLVGCTTEENAGFAADGYARVNGLSAVLVTYSVGGFRLINPIGGAFAEKSPVIVISGSPGLKERNTDTLLHHSVGDFNSQYNIFKNITCASTIIDDVNKGAFEIERCIEAARKYKRPAYIEIPRDQVDLICNYDPYTVGTPVNKKSDPEKLREIVSEVVSIIKNAKNPVLWVGVEISRYNLGTTLTKWAEYHNIPLATDILGKSSISEKHPLSMGVYSEGLSKKPVIDYFNSSDCIIMLGVMTTDMNLGFMPLPHSKNKLININTNKFDVKNHSYTEIFFDDFVNELCKTNIDIKNNFINPLDKNLPKWESGDCKLTTARLMEKLNSILDESNCVIADVGDSLFGSQDIIVHEEDRFIAPAFYTSMGFAIPASLGVQCAKPNLRPVVIVGDGAFQMTGQEISTIIRQKLNPIIIVLNNDGYGTERILLEGEFNDILRWNYHKVMDVFGEGKGVKVETELELDRAITEALESNKVFLINAVVEKNDFTPALKRMFSKLANKI